MKAPASALSARRFPMPARIVREALGAGLLHAGQSVLEVGAGALRNAVHLQSAGLRVHAVEEKLTVARFADDYQAFKESGGRVFVGTWPRGRYGAVVCTFVIGVVTPKAARLDLLRQIAGALKDTGILLLSARARGDVKTKTRRGRKWRDGFITPNGTFIKPFRRDELLRLAQNAGLRLRTPRAATRSNSGIIDLILVRTRP